MEYENPAHRVGFFHWVEAGKEPSRRPGSTWRSFFAEQIHSLEGVLLGRLAWFPSIGSTAMWNMAYGNCKMDIENW
ncbi:hypothetical protein RE6C_00808 [Rhodopirellula europaea 6C]|uniref:Uncharacterized protein n=1 Tax=Rhodopirellula europaea 6C TaxID=1263867 RepID=M2A8V1_9BACT|nr:hypothetical protein RE6C_00808 [Rhodopirellula europaea 6C]